jgi:hypothetical protein
MPATAHIKDTTKLDDDKNCNVGVLTTKTQQKLVALLVKVRKQNLSITTASQIASNSGTSIGTSPVAMPSPTKMDGQQSAHTGDATQDASSGTVGENIHNGTNGK